ncbi:unnamed protein product [Chironomus riparius]|uniref:C2 domain-containing protein n=1 Tax=Chironomus riparius TaxID=315576 RepID=A0A9N9RL39_9DIPT|nr:unnamed protein product [Chironomus riparius]
MDSMKNEDQITLSQVALYTTLSCIIVSLIAVLLYLTCSKRYKLNWFENNLLETAKENEENAQSHEVLVHCEMLNNNESSIAGSSRSLNRNVGSPISNTDDPTFWVPGTSSITGHCSDIHSDYSEPQSPTSPTSSNRSFALSVNSIPIVRSDKHVVLTSTSPARPKMASMQAKLDHTKIDTSLYQQSAPKRNSSMSSEDLRGTLHFTMLYDAIAGILTLRLIEAHDLQPRDFSGTADPYAKIRLLPDASKTNMWQTRIHKRTLNPVFDEDFVFEVRPATIGRRTLEILIYDFDAYSRHVCIGGLKIALAHVDLSDKVELWKSLGPCSEQDAKIELGDIMVSLSYLPSAERLTCVVIKARNLRVFDDTRNSSADPYVKVSIIYNGKRLKKKKTTVLRNTINPVFNEALTFDISRDMLKHSIIEFLVMHDNLLGANELLGRAVIGNSHEVRIEEKQFFDEIFRTKSATAQWIPLSDPRNLR